MKNSIDIFFAGNCRIKWSVLFLLIGKFLSILVLLIMFIQPIVAWSLFSLYVFCIIASIYYAIASGFLITNDKKE